MKKKKSKKKINEIKRILEIHNSIGNYKDPYFLGIHNGIELVLSIFLDKKPKFK
jgi:hypothetical protein